MSGGIDRHVFRTGAQRLEQIIARNSNCGDAQEQDYVKALSSDKVANVFCKRFLIQKNTSEAIFVSLRGVYTCSSNFLCRVVY